MGYNFSILTVRLISELTALDITVSRYSKVLDTLESRSIDQIYCLLVKITYQWLFPSFLLFLWPFTTAVL